MNIENMGLGRIVIPDANDKNFPMKSVLAGEPSLRTSRYWSASGWWGDQGNTSQCVGYAWAHWTEDGPVTQTGKAPIVKPLDIYTEAQKIDAWAGECVDTDTQVMTKTGWKYYNELKIGEDIYTVNLENQKGEWCKLDKINVFENTHLNKFYNSKTDIRVTDNHKWVVRDRTSYTKSAYLKETVNLLSKHTVPLSFESNEIPVIKTYSDEFVKLIAWVMTEGHLRNTKRKKHSIVISQKKFKKELQAVLQENNILVGYEKENGCFVSEFGKEFTEDIKNVIDINKNVNLDFISSLTLEQLNYFIDHSIMGDGSIINADNRATRRQFHQKKENGNIMIAFELACILSGKSISREKECREYFNKSKCCVEYMEKLNILSTDNIEIKSLKKESLENQTVWCPTSKNLTFLAKRKNTIFYTGNSYDGTSVRAGAKVLQTKGFIESYLWAWDVNTVIQAVLEKGPVVVGTEWTYDMFFPNIDTAIIKPTGNSAGGHAYLINGVNTKKKLFRIKNSWGRVWGNKGHAYISFDDMDKLIRNQGEACLAIEIKK